MVSLRRRSRKWRVLDVDRNFLKSLVQVKLHLCQANRRQSHEGKLQMNSNEQNCSWNQDTQE